MAGGCGEKSSGSAAKAEETLEASKETAINRRRFNGINGHYQGQHAALWNVR